MTIKAVVLQELSTRMVILKQSINPALIAVLFLLPKLYGLAIERPGNSAADFVSRSTAFSLDFYRKVFNPNENVILSPISIQSTLSLLYHVANENTASEMQRILGLPTDPEQSISILQDFLNRTNSDVLRMASKVYHSQFTLNPGFLPVLQESLAVEVEQADFTEKEKLADSVNHWAARSTKGLIDYVIDPADIGDNMHVILLNAIVLDAKWKKPFVPFTIEKPFHFTNGDGKVDMMLNSDEYHRIGEFDGLKVLELPYEDHTDLSMVLVMPTVGSLVDLVKKFNVELYQKLDGVLKLEWVNIEMPKFNTSSLIKAKDVLQSMGLEWSFSEGAFKVFDDIPAQLTELRQNAVIEVSESGTKAAAVTVALIDIRSGPEHEFIADHPFMYLIRRRSNKEILFIGHFSNMD